MPDQAPAFTDFGPLLDVIKSGDPRGLAAAKNLTPSEQQAFFDYQQQANKGKGEVTRTDNSVLGLPPELAAVSGLSLARSVAAPAANMGARVIAGAKNVVAQSTPLLKYEATKTTLEHFGVPTPLAMATAIAVSGYRGNGKPVPAAAPAADAAIPAAASSAPPTVAPVETAPVPSAPSAPPAPPSAPAPPAAATPVLGKMKLSSDEWMAVEGLVKEGKPLKQVLEALQKMRLPEAWRNLPSDADVAASVADRNATGKWPD